MASGSTVEKPARRNGGTIVVAAGDAFRGLSAEQLPAMSAAGLEVLELQRLFRKTGDNVVGELLRGAGTFTEWSHYPDGDAYDPETHAQYYYHAHPPEGRAKREHGHFHLFLRARGMPPGLTPAPGQALPKGENAILSHLVAISMDQFGDAIRLFTANRWVSGDVWYPAGEVARMLDGFRMEVVRPNLAVNRWITAMTVLFRPQILALLEARDRAVEAWARRHPGADVFEDRRLEVTSAIDISVERHVERIDRMLGRESRA